MPLNQQKLSPLIQVRALVLQPIQKFAQSILCHDLKFFLEAHLDLMKRFLSRTHLCL